MVQQSYPRHPLFHRAIRREIAAPSSVLMAMVQQSYPCHPSFYRTIRCETVAPHSFWWGMVQGNYPLRGYTFDRAGLMSAAKSTLSDDVRHRMLPPWGLYLFKIPAQFPHHPHFCECVNHDDAMPWMVTCNAFDSTKRESTTPKGVASRPPCSPG